MKWCHIYNDIYRLLYNCKRTDQYKRNNQAMTSFNCWERVNSTCGWIYKVWKFLSQTHFAYTFTKKLKRKNLDRKYPRERDLLIYYYRRCDSVNDLYQDATSAAEMNPGI